MKKIFPLIVCYLLSFGAKAQFLHYGFKIGGGLSTQKIQDPALISTGTLRTFDASIFVQVPVKYDFYVQISAALANKGVVVYEDALTTTNKITYAEIPVLIMRKINIPTLGNLALGIGGYFASGIKGSFDYETPNSTSTDKVSFGDSNDFQKNDAGLSGAANLELNNKLIFGLGYDYGLSNIAAFTAKDTGTSGIYNRQLTVSLGYIF